jgi:type II secretory pathway component PulJ
MVREMPRRDGFTLLELCLAIFIALLLISLVVPSLAGMRAEQKLTATFESFDKLVRTAQMRSVQERRPYHFIWEKGAVVLRPIHLRADEEPADIERYELSKERELVIERPAALKKNPPGEWPFWESGTCEPVRITYVGPEGKWVAEYDALTTQGRLVKEELR